MHMMETARAWLGNITLESLIKFGKTFGITALFTFILIVAGVVFYNSMADDQRVRMEADAAERAERLKEDKAARERSEERAVKDIEQRQRLLEKMVDSGIKRDEAMGLASVQTAESLRKLEAIADRQVVDHSSLIDAQKTALKNHDRMIDSIGKDCDATKELITLLKTMQRDGSGTKVRPVPAPKAGGT